MTKSYNKLMDGFRELFATNRWKWATALGLILAMLIKMALGWN